MCTKTKTSFGCGHCVKTIESCGIPNCQNLEKWKFPRATDCARCRAAGETSTRGKDGRGRHGMEQARHRESRQSSAEAPNPRTASSGTANLAISPWARKNPEVPQEKLWNTPTRQRADEAWVVEHERRQSDIEETMSKLSLRSTPRGSKKSTPRASRERFIEFTEIFDEPEDLDALPLQPKTVKFLPYEIEEASRTNSHSRSRSRKVSHDSEGSMPHYQESPLSKTPRGKTTRFVPPISEYTPVTYQDPGRTRQSGVRTEPYYAQSCSFESPMPRSHPTQESWMNQQEAVQAAYRDPYYPRTYPVY